jgi:hypothetical protein
MKARLKAIIAGALLVSATGCPGPAGSGQDLATTISNVQRYAVNACHFLPVADSVAKLIPYVSTADGIAELLCKALPQAESNGQVRAAAASLPGSNIAFPVNTAAGTVIVEGSRVQPGVSGAQANRPAAVGIGNGGSPVERQR